MIGIWDEIAAERRRAHALHGENSMESFDFDDLNCLAILVEEMGEVAAEFNEYRHSVGNFPASAEMAYGLLAVQLRKELIQTAAMAAAWADKIPAP